MLNTGALRIKPRISRGAGQTRYKKDLGYRHLGVDPKDVRCFPLLAIQLRRIARVARSAYQHGASNAPAAPLEYLLCSEDPEARRVVDAYRSVPKSYRRLLRPEAFCHVANVSPEHVLEIITAIAVRQGAQASAVLASVLHPKVVEKTVERALEEGGIRERQMLHKACGFLT